MTQKEMEDAIIRHEKVLATCLNELSMVQMEVERLHTKVDNAIALTLSAALGFILVTVIF